MSILYKLKIREDVQGDLERQDGALQTMLEWKKNEAPEFRSTLRLYLSARRFLRHLQKIRLFILPFTAGTLMQDVACLMA